jgi:putative nucleotidyltransferase with HDIG domain
VNTSQSVAAFSITDFEIGQISDRTIIATKTLPADDMNPVSVVEGEKIIKKGFPISEDAYNKLEKMASSPVYLDYRAFANSELYLLLLAFFWYIVYSFTLCRNNKKLKLREPLVQIIFFILLYGFTAFGRKIPYFANSYSICIIIPSTLFVLLVVIIYGTLPATLFSVILSMGVLNASSWQLIPFLYTLSSSLTAVCIVRKIEKRVDLFFASLILAVIDVIILIFLMTIFNDTFSDVGKIFLGVAFNGFISGILTFGFLTPLELLLNTASVFRLMDLSDLNNPIMRKMMVNASGTYQHSVMVAQLAERGCREIGANALIARVGGYYHDIGKIDQSQYFVENQKGENKHDEINPTLSISIIKSHVKKGVEKARQLHLPEQIIDIIAEHHGTSVISYFFSEAKKKDDSLEPEDCSYPGPLPSTRESGVVMLADTVEAACKTLKNPSVPSLEKFITSLISAKIEHNQLDNCGLTYADITKLKNVFVQILAGFYHSRIEYPDQKKEEAAKNENHTEIRSENRSELHTESENKTETK